MPKIRPLGSPTINCSHVLQIPLLLVPYQVPSPLPQDPPVQPVRQVDLPVELLRHDERAHLLPTLVHGSRISGSQSAAKSAKACQWRRFLPLQVDT